MNDVTNIQMALDSRKLALPQSREIYLLFAKFMTHCQILLSFQRNNSAVYKKFMTCYLILLSL